jgi:hypothetical protein
MASTTKQKGEYDAKNMAKRAFEVPNLRSQPGEYVLWLSR